MRILYIDNIHRFQDCYIPIRDVNFLVGEKSTGKTSVLELINLISSNYLWARQEFNTHEITLGNFDDIVSISSKDKSLFKIGLIDLSEDKKEDNRAFLMIFTEKEGLPIISTYNMIKNNEKISLKFTEKDIEYKRVEYHAESITEDKIIQIFKEWIKNQNEKGYITSQKFVVPPQNRTKLLKHYFKKSVSRRIKIFENRNGRK